MNDLECKVMQLEEYIKILFDQHEKLYNEVERLKIMSGVSPDSLSDDDGYPVFIPK